MEKIRQGQRRRILERYAFTEFEAEALKVVPIKPTPYFKDLCQERVKEHQRWLNDGRTEADWLQHIIERYRANSWYKRDDFGTPIADPFKMLRDFEDRYRDRHPQYVSPWEKKTPRMSSVEVRTKMLRTVKSQRATARKLMA